MYAIVVGAGQIGSQVIDLLSRSNNEIVVIERNEAVADEIGRNYDCLVLHADATEKETLLEAGADRADSIICTTDQDATNVMVLLMAEELEIPSRVTVVQNPEHMSLFRRIGANVLENPQRLIAEYLVRAVQRPAIKDFMSLSGDAEVFEITVTDSAPIAGKTIAEADEAGLIGEEILIVAIERDDTVITPRGGAEIKPGDLITVFSREGATVEATTEFTGDVTTE
ncbi:MAG: TrkA family potassium uptake protein [Halodesulfurarchaeum sp.]